MTSVSVVLFVKESVLDAIEKKKGLGLEYIYFLLKNKIKNNDTTTFSIALN
jgi:hypothetical protein